MIYCCTDQLEFHKWIMLIVILYMGFPTQAKHFVGFQSIQISLRVIVCQSISLDLGAPTQRCPFFETMMSSDSTYIAKKVSRP